MVIAPAGNTNGEAVVQPAAHPDALAVTALGSGGAAATYSARGPEIDLAAPGGTGGLPNGDDLLTLNRQDGYIHVWGTSHAVGYVAGTAALLYAAKPTATLAEVRDALIATAVEKGDLGTDSVYGHGMVNPYQALQKILGRPWTPTIVPVDVNPSPPPLMGAPP